MTVVVILYELSKKRKYQTLKNNLLLYLIEYKSPHDVYCPLREDGISEPAYLFGCTAVGNLPSTPLVEERLTRFARFSSFAQRRSAICISAADWKRSTGSFSNVFMTIFSTSGGTVG